MGFVVNVELKSFLWRLNVMAGKKIPLGEENEISWLIVRIMHIMYVTMELVGKWKCEKLQV